LNTILNKKVKHVQLGHIEYKKALEIQEEIFQKTIKKKIENRKNETNILTENYVISCSHPHVYTIGKSGDEKNLLLDKEVIKKKKLEFFKISRGGDITYHGPGQIVVYPIIDLENFFTDIHLYLRKLEEAVIKTLKSFKIKSGRIKDHTGVWVNHKSEKAKKICAMGVKSSRWVTMHGLALNVKTDLNYFNNIIPCGINDKTVTSIENELNTSLSLKKVENEIIKNLFKVFKFDSYIN
tara:strand:- start:4391 stop:5104 length:714 start_codon:yes stop_codon:yes gene_type:complete